MWCLYSLALARAGQRLSTSCPVFMQQLVVPQTYVWKWKKAWILGFKKSKVVPSLREEEEEQEQLRRSGVESEFNLLRPHFFWWCVCALKPFLLSFFLTESKWMHWQMLTIWMVLLDFGLKAGARCAHPVLQELFYCTSRVLYQCLWLRVLNFQNVSVRSG